MSNLRDLKQDRVFSVFLNDDFNLQNTVASISNLPFNDQLSKISSGIDYVKYNISLLTSQNCEEFFQRTSKLDDLYQELQFIQIKSQNLSQTLELMKSKLEIPYQQLLRQIFLISRLQKTCDLLRKMLRIIHLSKRIYECNLEAFKHEHEHTIYLKEIVKVTQYLNEVDMIISSDEEQLLFKLKLIEKDLQRIEQIKADLTQETGQLMTNGLNNSDLNMIGTALQVFHNLGLLDLKLNDLIKDKCTLIGQVITKNLKIPELKSGKSSLSIGQNSSIRNTLRNNIKSLLDSILNNFIQISTVVKLLRKKRDNISQNLLIESIANKDEIMPNFWLQITQILSSLITKHVNESMTLKKLIESDYPKVLPIFIDFWKAIVHNEPEVGSEKSLRSVLLNFESAYLSNSLSLLFDSVNRIFSDAKESNKSMSVKVISVPSEKDVEAVVRSMEQELSIASIDSQLLSSVCKNLFKTMNLFMVRCEHLASLDGDSTQVIGPLTNSQRHNILIVHILNFFAKQMRNILKNYAQVNTIKHNLEGTLASMDNLILNIFEPLVTSIQDAIEAIIMTMYNEDFNADSCKNEDSVQCSLYMKELQRFICRVSQDYLSQFAECAVIENRISQMASTTIDSFLLHKCLLTPVSEQGRRKMAADFSQLELAIVLICERMGNLGRSYQVLRAFKTLLFLAPEQIAASPVLGNPVPFYLILHFLISNYNADANALPIMLPHKYMDWSVTRYLKWVHNSTDEQRLTLFNDVLDSYVKQVRKTQMKTFTFIYPILVDIMKHALNDSTNIVCK